MMHGLIHVSGDADVKGLSWIDGRKWDGVRFFFNVVVWDLE